MVSLPNMGAKGSQFILFIGDEGAILVYMEGRHVVKRLFAPNVEPANVRSLLDLLTMRPDIPLRLLVDAIDQSYVRHSLPPVSALSVGKLIKRRLERDFPAEDIKGAVMIDREKEGRKDWNYLLISLSATPLITRWLEWVSELPNPLRGVHLVPVEGENYVRAISKVISDKRGNKPSSWQLLVSHHKVGGFRQIVLKGGRLIFTRLAQPIGETVPEVIAGNIEQEVMNTIEYLKRLSFEDEQNLDIFIIVSEEIKQSIDRKKFKNEVVEIFTPYEAAQALQLDQAALPSDHFGDVVMAAAFGAERKKRLRLFNRSTQRLNQLDTAISLTRKLAALGTVLILLGIGMTAWEMFSLKQEHGALEEQQQVVQRTIDEVQASAKKLPDDLNRITDVISIYELFSKKDRGPQDFVAQLKPTLADGILVGSLHWSTVPDKANPNSGNTYVKAEMSVEFRKHTGDVDKFVTQVREFVNRLKAQFPDYRVTYEKLPGVLEDTDTVEMSFGKDTVAVGKAIFDAGKTIEVNFVITDEPETQGGR